MTLFLALRSSPNQRVDLSPLLPRSLAGRSEAEIAALPIHTTRERLAVGDLFAIRMGDPDRLHFEGGSERFDQIGQGMADGEIVVSGDVGAQTGRAMSAGRIIIEGSTGSFAGSGMTGGLLRIERNAGDRLGGPLAGETAGMRGGLILVRRNAGDRAGDRMRRGTILIEGRAGSNTGSRMIAGTLIVAGGVGRMPGYLMRRGSIVLGAGAEELAPTFVDCGTFELTFGRIMEKSLRALSARTAALVRRKLRRLAGDMAVLGKGEILLAE